MSSDMMRLNIFEHYHWAMLSANSVAKSRGRPQLLLPRSHELDLANQLGVETPVCLLDTTMRKPTVDRGASDDVGGLLGSQAAVQESEDNPLAADMLLGMGVAFGVGDVLLFLGQLDTKPSHRGTLGWTRPTMNTSPVVYLPTTSDNVILCRVENIVNPLSPEVASGPRCP